VVSGRCIANHQDQPPIEGRVTYVWPDVRVEQSLADFTSGEWDVLR
jgi:hypothetical protein